MSIVVLTSSLFSSTHYKIDHNQLCEVYKKKIEDYKEANKVSLKELEGHKVQTFVHYNELKEKFCSKI
jgi:hypothetical protein